MTVPSKNTGPSQQIEMFLKIIFYKISKRGQPYLHKLLEDEFRPFNQTAELPSV